MAGKSPGFWFFVGDWMKDTELRFCSLFARGLLVDLLCLMFESKERGYLSTPDGSPRSDESIVDAVSGGSQTEKLKALRELEASGVLSRDERGVLHSRRLAKLGELTEVRKQAGSKGGSKQASNTEANVVAKHKANEQQNKGVTDSDSVSVLKKETKQADDDRFPSELNQPDFLAAWDRWRRHRLQKQKPLGSIEEEAQLLDLMRFGAEEAAQIVGFTIRTGAVNLITNGDHRGTRASGGGKGRSSKFAIIGPE